MEKSRPQLSQIELHQFRWLLGGVLGILSAWTVFYMEVDALIALAVITPTVPIFTYWPRLSRGLPTIFHRLAFPLIVTIFAFDLWNNREPLPAMIRLDLMLLGYRCISPRGRREDLQLILLALFVVVVTGVFTVSPAFVVQILFFTGTALVLLLAVTLSDARAGGEAQVATAGWEEVDWKVLMSRLRAVADLRVLALTGGLFLGVVGLSALLFLALPRFEISNDFFIDRLISKKSRTGFSETVRFGEVNEIAQDSGMAFAVDVSDPAAVPSEPYWRMVVLDQYSNEGFRMSESLQRRMTGGGAKSQVHRGVGGDGTRHNNALWTVYYQPGVSRYLPLTGGFERLTFTEPQALRQSRALRIAGLSSEPAKMVGYRIEGMDTSGTMSDERFAMRRLASFRVAAEELASALSAMGTPSATEDPVTNRPDEEVNPGLEQGEGVREGRERERSLRAPSFLDLGGVNPADATLLKDWVHALGGAGVGGPDFARRAAGWLHSSHSYSLNSSTPQGEGDIIVRWMGSKEPGHCELFAGSIVLLARTAGIPARLVTGFKGGAWNPTSGSITVRNSDAHAWTELWDDASERWIRVDATPGADVTPPALGEPGAAAGTQMSQDTGWGARMDGLRVFWYRRVVSFDQSSQLELLRGSKEQLRDTLLAVRTVAEQWLRAIAEWVRQPWDFGRIAGIVSAAGVVAGAIVFWRRAGRSWWMGWRSRRSASHGQDPVRREASRWLARLERKRNTSGPETAWPGDLLEFDAVRAELLRLRFGAREGWQSPAAVFARARRLRRGRLAPAR